MKKYINIYTVMPLLLCPLLQLITWGLSTGVFEHLIKGNIEYVLELLGRNDFFLGGTYKFFIDGFAVMQMVLPLLSVLGSCAFMRIYGGFSACIKPRIMRYSRYAAKDILIISATASAAMYIGFLIYAFIGIAITGYNPSENYSRSFLNDFFGAEFSWKNPITYYLIEGIYKYAVFTFVYCVFACTVYLFFGKKHLTIIIPVGYYIIVTLIGGVLYSPLYGTIFGETIKAFRPSNMLMMGAESGSIPVWYPLISLIPPVIASIIFFVKGIRNEEKYG